VHRAALVGGVTEDPQREIRDSIVKPNADVRSSSKRTTEYLDDAPVSSGRRAEDARAVAAARAVQHTTQWLLDHQHADGYWCGELQGDTILESEYLLLLAWLGREQTEIARLASNYLVEQQLPSGGWAMYPGGRLEISGSVKAYFALKLTGHDPQAEYMQRARSAIREHGGADAVNSFTRFYLALLGQISYDQCPAVPPEAVLLPKWSPINLYRISAWSRTIVVPLSIMWAFRPVRQIDASRGIGELFLRKPEDWPITRCPGLSKSLTSWGWERFFRLVNGTAKFFERHGIRPLRRRALRVAERWMIDRFADSDGLGAIFPPIVWCIVALKCLGYDDESDEVQYCHRQLEDLAIRERDTIRLEPCKSPVWDTAITLRALSAAGVSPCDDAVMRATDWLLSKEVRCPGDWSQTVAAKPAGWFFEHRNLFYPDTDDTAMVLMALNDYGGRADRGEDTAGTKNPTLLEGTAADLTTARRRADLIDRAAAATRRGTDWLLGMQNSDGGWGAFDRNNDAQFLCHVPFADHNAMIDPSTPDLSSRVLEALVQVGPAEDADAWQRAMRRSIEYVRQNQEPDGAWFGRWGVNYIYGTWQTLVGLIAAGVPENDPAIVRGAQWLMACQQSSGGWGESADSYDDPSLRGQGPETASQTAWALLGLIAAGRHADSTVQKGIDYLVRQQNDDGTWDEPFFTGTGFPRVFYLRYHLYRIYFPLMALATWRS
jgi:squalene-hopene/tetraprenyl-beta-curcumene cyclase